jgi:hypothetical protein
VAGAGQGTGAGAEVAAPAPAPAGAPAPVSPPPSLPTLPTLTTLPLGPLGPLPTPPHSKVLGPPDRLNRLTAKLVRWPVPCGACVLCAGVGEGGAGLGDTVWGKTPPVAARHVGVRCGAIGQHARLQENHELAPCTPPPPPRPGRQRFPHPTPPTHRQKNSSSAPCSSCPCLEFRRDPHRTWTGGSNRKGGGGCLPRRLQPPSDCPPPTHTSLTRCPKGRPTNRDKHLTTCPCLPQPLIQMTTPTVLPRPTQHHHHLPPPPPITPHNSSQTFYNPPPPHLASPSRCRNTRRVGYTLVIRQYSRMSNL